MIGADLSVAFGQLGNAAGAPDYTLSLNGLSSNPTHGQTAEIGVALTVVASGFTAGMPGTIAYQWRDGAGDIPGATSDSFTPGSAQDLAVISCVVTPDGYPTKETPGHVARYPGPALSTPLPDQTFITGSGIQTYDAAPHFLGTDLSFSITAGPGGVTVSAAGILSVDTDVTGDLSGVTVSVEATNSGGTAGGSFALTVEDPMVVLTGLTNNPTHGQTAEIGTSLGISASGTVSAYRWFTGSGDVATTEVYVPQAADDLETLRCGVTIAGTEFLTQAYTVRFAPPAITTSSAISPGTAAAGQVFTLTEPVAPNTTITLTSFTLAGISKLSELIGLTWNSAGEAPGALVATFSVSNSGGTVIDAATATVSSASGNALTIVPHAASAVAEQGVRFTVSGRGSLVGDLWKDILYTWDMGETGATYINHDPDNYWPNDPNLHYGPLIAHSFTTYGAGTTNFTVTVTARDRFGNIETGQLSFPVTHPDAATTGTTYVVAFDGDFTGAPAGTQISNFSSLKSTIEGLSGANVHRVRMKGGDTFTFSDHISVDNEKLIIDAWGSGKPNLRNNGASWNEQEYWRVTSGSEWVLFKGMDIRCDYNPLTGIATGGTWDAIDCRAGASAWVSAHNMTMRNNYKNYLAVAGVNFFVSDADSYGWKDYNAFIDTVANSEGGFHAYGGRHRQIDELVGVDTHDGKYHDSNPDLPDHGPFRGPDNAHVYFGNVLLASRNGWSSENQPCARCYHGAPTWVSDFCFDRVFCLNGGLDFSTRNASTNSTTGCRTLVDKLIVLGEDEHSDRTNAIANVWGDTTVRNAILIYPQIPNTTREKNIEVKDRVSNGQIPLSAASGPVEFYNIMQYSGDDATFEEIDDLAEWPGGSVTLANSFTYAPNAANAASFHDGSNLDTEANLFKPTAGSAFIDAGTGPLWAIDDIDGNLRAPGSFDVGPWEAGTADTTAPVLTMASDAADGQTASTGSVTTDEGNGTLYVVVTQSGTTPSAAQVIAGLDHTGAAADAALSQPVASTGAQAIAATGLVAGVSYVTHFLQEDAAGNRSSVVSALGFTTDAAGLGLAGPHDYFIDANTGSDANAGTSEGAAWASLNNVTEALLVSDQTVRILVKSGTYGTASDFIKINNMSATNATLELAFEQGSIIDGSAYAGNESALDPQGNAFTFRVYGNGTLIRNVTTTTGNALGGTGSVTCHYHNFTVDNCVDGMTLHDNALGYFHDITVANCAKSGVAHVNSSSAFHYRCHVTEKVGGGTGNVVVCDAGAMEFEDCIMVPDANGGTVDLDNASLTRCQVGSLTTAAKIVATVGASSFSKCFVNAYVDGNGLANFDRCFGLFTTRCRNGGDIDVTHCSFAGPATSQNRTLFSNYNPGSNSQLVLKDTIFSASYTFSQVDTTNAGYLVAAASEFHNNFLTDGKVYDADIVAADTGGTVIQGTQTGDPLVGSADTVLMADYAFGAGSPAIGAGSGGSDIGFGAGEVEERQPQITY